MFASEADRKGKPFSVITTCGNNVRLENTEKVVKMFLFWHPWSFFTKGSISKGYDKNDKKKCFWLIYRFIYIYIYWYVWKIVNLTISRRIFFFVFCVKIFKCYVKFLSFFFRMFIECIESLLIILTIYLSIRKDNVLLIMCVAITIHSLDLLSIPLFTFIIYNYMQESLASNWRRCSYITNNTLKRIDCKAIKPKRCACNLHITKISHIRKPFKPWTNTSLKMVLNVINANSNFIANHQLCRH